jgi:hypothetical protein
MAASLLCECKARPDGSFNRRELIRTIGWAETGQPASYYLRVSFCAQEQQFQVVWGVPHLFPRRGVEMRNIEALHRCPFHLVQADATGPRRNCSTKRSGEPLQLDAAIDPVPQELRVQQVQMEASVAGRASNQDPQLKVIESAQQSLFRRQTSPIVQQAKVNFLKSLDKLLKMVRYRRPFVSEANAMGHGR